MLYRVEHVELRVEDLDDALAFYTGPMGLAELERDGDAVYLGCGLDGNFDLAVVEGGTGLEHVAFRAEDSAAVDAYEARLLDGDVEVERRDGADPGQAAAIRFDLPSGAPVEIAAVEDAGYKHSDVARGDRGGAAPTDLDHVTLLSPSIEEDARFLEEHADFKLSDVVGPADDWEMVFTRCNVFHHDLALRASFPESPDHASLHHVAWEFDSIEHIKLFLDRISQAGVEVERGLGRHFAGDNLYAYFWSPCGNRFELCAEMAEVRSTEPTHVEDYETATVVWGPGAPESFRRGSGLVR